MQDESQNTNGRELSSEQSLRGGHAVQSADARVELDRRRFLEAAGFSLSLAAFSGCGRAPVQLALPFVEQPENTLPGQVRTYASTCSGCPAACGLLVSTRDGRPLKMEGMPAHPLSQGGLCAVGQALPLGLYDSHRLDHPLQGGKPAKWEDVDRTITQRLRAAATEGAVRVVTAPVHSPTLVDGIEKFLEPFADGRHVTLDTISCSAILDAHQTTHGVRRLPHYQLDHAQVIVSLGADFLGTWISPVEFTAAWRKQRVPTAEHPDMSYHVHFEGRMSLTGSNADKRFRLAPSQYGNLLNHLAAQLAHLAEQPTLAGNLDDPPIPADELAALAQRLWKSRGKNLVLCDSQNVADQALVNYINDLLGNYGQTLDLTRPSQQRSSDDRQLLQLIDELKSGQVTALLVAGTDLAHHLPARKQLLEALGKVPLIISLAEREDDFASHAHFVCPDHHPLESWMDAEPIAGLISLVQPTVQPLRGTRSILESLARWSGRTESAYEILQSTWERKIFPRSGKSQFEAFWQQSLHDGFTEVEVTETASPAFRLDGISLTAPRARAKLSLSLYAKVGLPDSRHAHNPWLQELPDPVTKVTWDNYVTLSPGLAADLKVKEGDVLEVARGDQRVTLPALVQPGQHDGVLAVALGYGVRGTDRFANIGAQWIHAKPTVATGGTIGRNAAGLITVKDGLLQYDDGEITVRKTGDRHVLAKTQLYDSLVMPANVAPRGAEIRHTVESTTLGAFRKDNTAGSPHHHPATGELWPDDHTKDGHWWGMVVDLNACTGCSACLIACQSENNVPVVGKDEVRRQREMHWLRVDRYYEGDGDEVAVAHQPMMCQHCDHAPCETVCPVLATVHSDEGLNEQVYNRCVGTRYCANNCPYKVRRFNWFEYRHDDEFENLALNPGVTVRGRGVMEKCSMCVQRIEEARINARRQGEPLADGDILTACQQSCPAQAIVFGDMHDPDSRVTKALEDPRRFRVLEEFNFRPSVAYLRVVRNRDEEDSEGGDHA